MPTSFASAPVAGGRRHGRTRPLDQRIDGTAHSGYAPWNSEQPLRLVRRQNDALYLKREKGRIEVIAEMALFDRDGGSAAKRFAPLPHGVGHERQRGPRAVVELDG